MKLNRTKEEGITNLLTQYISATDEKEKQMMVTKAEVFNAGKKN